MAGEQVSRFPHCPGKEFLADLQRDVHAGPNDAARAFLEALSRPDSVAAAVSVVAPPLVVFYAAAIGQKMHFYVLDFEGLVPRAVVTPQPQCNLRITSPRDAGNVIHFVPFLGTESLIRGKEEGASITFELPTLERGAIAWLERAK